MPGMNCAFPKPRGRSSVWLLVLVTTLLLGAAASVASAAPTTAAADSFAFDLQYSGGGHISPEGYPLYVAAGGTITFSIVAEDCYRLVGLEVDGIPQGAVTSYTFTNVQADHILYAEFARTHYNITSTALPGGVVIPGGDVSVACGDSITFEIQPTCQVVQSVVVDGVAVGAVTSYTFRDVRADHTISASFTAAAPSLTLSFRPAPLRCDIPDTLTATLNPNSSGVVAFLDFNQQIGSALIVGNKATLVVTPPLAPGPHSLRASYAGGSCSGPLATGVQNVTVSSTPTDTAVVALSVGYNPIAGGNPVNYTASLSIHGQPAPWLNGVIDFFDNGTYLSSLNSLDGTSTLTAIPASAGTHVITARFGGNGCVAVSHSNAVNLQVTLAVTNLQFVAAPEPSFYGQPVTYWAWVQVNGQTVPASGTFTFLDGSTVLDTVSALGGQSSFNPGLLDVGNHVITVVYSGDALYGPSQQAFSVRVNVAPTTFGVVSSANPSAHLSVMLTAFISPTGSGGTVTFSDVGGVFATVPVVAGAASTPYRAPTFGSWAITASYSGDAQHQPATTIYAQQCVGAVTSVNLSSTRNPELVGRPITFSARVSPPPATGTITFRDNLTVLQTVALTGDLATYTTSALALGTHPMSASYNGDTTYVASSGSLSQQVVSRFPTSTTLSSSQNPAQIGYVVVLTAQVAPAGASGSVEFKDNGLPLATIALVAGSASLNYLQPSGPIRTLTATYLGDSLNAPSTGTLFQQGVPKLASTLACSSSTNPGVLGTTVTISAFVSPAAATGTVQFKEGATVIATQPVVAGVATTPYLLASLGAHGLSASYSGDSTYDTSTRSFSQLVLSTLPVSLVITSSANPDTGRSVTLTFRVSPAAASGTVAVTVNGVPTATLTLSGGVATMPLHVNAFGTYAISGSYSGDATYGTTSATFQQSFVARPTSIALTSSPAAPRAEELFTLTARITPAQATGNITFSEAGTVLGTAALAGGVATLQLSFPVMGTHLFNAVFPGDTIYGSSSRILAMGVLGKGTTTTLTTTSGAVLQGSWVTFTARVVPVPPSGSVTFTVDGSNVATVAVSGGVAQYSTSTLPIGPHTVTARFGGSLGLDASDSAPVSVSVGQYMAATLHVLAPNGHETWLVGSTQNILWETLAGPASPRVSLYISRTEPPTWELIAMDVPNSGSFAWTIPGPGTNLGPTAIESALIGVFDESGASGSDASDLGFSLFDLATETGLTQLDAEPLATGVRLSWSAASRSLFTTFELQRAPALSGPWLPLDAGLHDEGERAVAVDATAEPGRTYWYRVLGTTNAGDHAIVGPTSATSGAALEFALAPAHPNPSSGAMTIGFTVARMARVRLSVIDLQGREVAVLAEGVQTAGRHEARWDGLTRGGSAASAGLYFVRYAIPGRTLNGRLSLVR